MPPALAEFTPYLSEVDSHLSDVLGMYRSPSCLYDPVRYLFDAGGKRIRPLLVVLSAEACGTNWRPAVPAAVAVELLHTFTLVHDDIMDKSALRRGRETVHVRWGDSLAILAGDVMMGIAMRELERSARSAARPMDVVAAFSSGLIDVCDGQALDLDFQTRHNVTEDEYIEMITKKTAKLLEMSVCIGAAIAGASNEHTNALKQFARNLGIAFQLQDDVLDVVGGEGFGKTPGGDLVEGKRTWLVLASLKRAVRSDHRQRIESFFANGGIAVSEVVEMRTMMDELGVIRDARQRVHDVTTAAYTFLEQLPATPARNTLAALGRMLMNRTS